MNILFSRSCASVALLEQAVGSLTLNNTPPVDEPIDRCTTTELEEQPQSVSPEELLQNELENIPVEKELNELISHLIDEESFEFACLAPRDQIASILLLMLHAQKTKNTDYLDAVLFAIPYCRDFLHHIDIKNLFISRQTSEEKFEKTLTAVGQDFVRSSGRHISPRPVSKIDFIEFLRLTPIDRETDFLADAIATWCKKALPSPNTIAVVIHNYALLGIPYKYLPEPLGELECSILKEVFKKHPNCRTVFHTLIALSNPDELPDLEWAKTLKKGPVRTLAFELANHPHFPGKLQKELFRSLPPELALHMMPSLTATHLIQLGISLDKSQNAALLKPFTKRLHLIPDDKRAKLADFFPKLTWLIQALERDMREHPTHPGRDFFVQVVTSPQFPPKFKTNLYNLFFNDGVPLHYKVLAARIVQDSENETIATISKLFLAHKNDPQLQATLLAEFYLIERSVRHKIIKQILDTNSDEGVLFVSSFERVLPLSAVVCLLDKIEQLPVTESLRSAFHNIQTATWFGDCKQPVAECWFEKKNLVIFSMTDRSASIVLEKMQKLATRLNAPLHDIVAKLENTIEMRKNHRQAEQKKKTSVPLISSLLIKRLRLKK